MSRQPDDQDQAPYNTNGAADLEQTAANTPPPDDLTAARLQVEEFRLLLQRERADFINYRRRVDAERTAQLAQGRVEAMLPLFDILDDLERAGKDVPAEIANHKWVKGVLLITNKLSAAINAAGFERIDALGQLFDPRLHESLFEQPHDTVPAGHVTTVIRNGYKLGDRVVRAAQVGVSRGASE